VAKLESFVAQRGIPLVTFLYYGLFDNLLGQVLPKGEIFLDRCSRVKDSDYQKSRLLHSRHNRPCRGAAEERHEITPFIRLARSRMRALSLES
jgi:hypothetical protein